MRCDLCVFWRRSTAQNTEYLGYCEIILPLYIDRAYEHSDRLCRADDGCDLGREKDERIMGEETA